MLLLLRISLSVNRVLPARFYFRKFIYPLRSVAFLYILASDDDSLVRTLMRQVAVAPGSPLLTALVKVKDAGSKFDGSTSLRM